MSVSPSRPVSRAFAVALSVAGFAAPVLAVEPPPAFTVCKTCHKAEAGINLIGPSVVGRKAGTGPGFAYSDALKGSGLVWDEASLTKYIGDPKATVPGNKMAFAGVKKPDDVKAIIAFLAALK